MSADESVLIVGIGNVFRADDGFGVEVARRLLSQPLPGGTQVRELGIRGFDLAYALMDPGFSRVIVLDAVPRGKPAGTLSLIEPEIAAASDWALPDLLGQSHGMDPFQVLRWVRAQGARTDHVLILGCEPLDLGSEDEAKMELSPPVGAAVDEAVELVMKLAVPRKGIAPCMS